MSTLGLRLLQIRVDGVTSCWTCIAREPLRSQPALPFHVVSPEHYERTIIGMIDEAETWGDLSWLEAERARENVRGKAMALREDLDCLVPR